MKNSVLWLSYIVGVVDLLLVLYFFLTGKASTGAAFLVLGVAVVVALQPPPKKR
jgi:hypothetical protein